MASKCFGLLALLIAFSTVLIFAYTSITTSDYFSAKTIGVSGNRHLTRQEILAQANFQPGDNILALNLRLMRKRLMRHPWISAVRISRQIPNTVTIVVEEHRPLAAMDLGRRLLVDDRNVVPSVFAERLQTLLLQQHHEGLDIDRRHETDAGELAVAAECPVGAIPLVRGEAPRVFFFQGAHGHHDADGFDENGHFRILSQS